MAGIEGRYDFTRAEPRLLERWADTGLYEFDPRPGGRPFTVDTPPPTISGQLHVGHVYSYTHADIVIRYRRMKGEQVLDPFGFDDNGLPTERFVERVRGLRVRETGQRTLGEACLELSQQVEMQFERFWKRLGLSVDWRLRYSTIDPRSRRVSQAAFVDLYQKGHAYRREAPTLWCPTCGTAVAQAEVDDRPGLTAALTSLAFHLEGGSELPIATTPPELLPAGVAVFVHPSDDAIEPWSAGGPPRGTLSDLVLPRLLGRRPGRAGATTG